MVQDPYTNVLVLYVEGITCGIYGLDNASYNKFLRHKFNDVEPHSFRENLSTAFLNQLPNARIFGKESFFNVQQDYTYTEFMEAIKENGVQSLIVVSTNDGNNIMSGLDANKHKAYHSCMLDLEKNQLIWYQGGEIVSSDSYDSIFAKRIAKLAAKDLKKNNIISN